MRSARKVLHVCALRHGCLVANPLAYKRVGRYELPWPWKERPQGSGVLLRAQGPVTRRGLLSLGFNQHWEGNLKVCFLRLAITALVRGDSVVPGPLHQRWHWF